MNIYLDVSCLNRPFDDQSQTRIRLEAEAVTLILQQIEAGRARQVSSEIADIEIAGMGDAERRRRVAALLPPRESIMRLAARTFVRATALERLGFKPADALHVAAAQVLEAVFLTCDDRLCRLGLRHASKLRTRVLNPLAWLKERPNAHDA
jgi:predicted nucleic acid-binding protein